MRKDILKYFKEQKEMTPIFYYWKKRDKEIMEFLSHTDRSDYKLYGDMENFYNNEYGEFDSNSDGEKLKISKGSSLAQLLSRLNLSEIMWRQDKIDIKDIIKEYRRDKVKWMGKYAQQ